LKCIQMERIKRNIRNNKKMGTIPNVPVTKKGGLTASLFYLTLR
jgi:hypothetical protein